jgi:hypothetical protein
MVLGAVLAIACGRTELEALVRPAASAGADAGTGGAGVVVSGPCAEATCLASLFQTCVPDGLCYVQGGASPNAVYNAVCYANGVSVSYVGSYNGPDVTRKLTVSRNGLLCYGIDESTPMYTNGATYAIRGADGQEVATGALVDKSGSVTVTCTGGRPVSVPSVCLRPMPDNDGCAPGTCP